MPDRLTVPAADFIRNIGHWQSEALKHPVSITYHGRERLVLAAADEFRPPDIGVASATLQAEYSALRAMSAALLDQIDEGYLAFDESLNLRHANTVAEAFAGKQAVEMQEQGVLHALPEPFASMLTDRLRRVARTRKAERFDVGPIQGKHLSVRVFPAGSGVSVVFQNTTEQQRLRAEREESDALSVAFAQHARTAALRLDVRGRLEHVGESFCMHSGFAAADIVGHRLVEIVPPSHRGSVMEAVERVLRVGGQAVVDLTIVGKRGQEVSGVLSLAPILSDYTPRGVLGLWMIEVPGTTQNAAGEHRATG